MRRNMRNTKDAGEKEFIERALEIKRVSKKTTGGNKIGFTALMVIGDKKGNVGSGLGKALSVPNAVKKGISQAKKNMIHVQLNGGTVPHEVSAKYKSSQIMLKPAPIGSGVIAGGAARDVLELAGVKDVSSKLMGSNSKNTTVMCTLEALKKLKIFDGMVKRDAPEEKKTEVEDVKKTQSKVANKASSAPAEEKPVEKPVKKAVKETKVKKEDK